jgi:hypothetical protein
MGKLFFPEDSARWRTQLVSFAQKIGKPDPEEYVDDRGWVKRFGGAGLPNSFSGIEAKPCGDMDNTIQIEVTRPVDVELEEFLKPLGRINRDRSRPALGEIYIEGRPGQNWSAILVQAPQNSTSIRFSATSLPTSNIRPASSKLVFSARLALLCAHMGRSRLSLTHESTR